MSLGSSPDLIKSYRPLLHITPYIKPMRDDPLQAPMAVPMDVDVALLRPLPRLQWVVAGDNPAVIIPYCDKISLGLPRELQDLWVALVVVPDHQMLVPLKLIEDLLHILLSTKGKVPYQIDGIFF